MGPNATLLLDDTFVGHFYADADESIDVDRVARDIAFRYGIHDRLVGAIRFILAFYEPGQTHLDTEAWKVAEASARAVMRDVDAAP